MTIETMLTGLALVAVILGTMIGRDLYRRLFGVRCRWCKRRSRERDCPHCGALGI